jgi:hypothetical protein
VSFVSGLLGAKRLEMLRQLVPTAATSAMLVGTDTLEARVERRDVCCGDAAFVIVRPLAASRQVCPALLAADFVRYSALTKAATTNEEQRLQKSSIGRCAPWTALKVERARHRNDPT